MLDFQHLDSSQRTLRGMVESFQAYLPERAASSGLVPRFRVLDQEAERLIGDYLATLDQHPFGETLDARALGAAHRAYAEVGPRLAKHADALDQVVLDYDGELTRIGQQVQRGRRLKDEASARTQRVAAAAKSLRATGLEVPELNDVLARTRAAAVAASGWEPSAGFRVLEQAVAELESLAVVAEDLAKDYPQRVARARTRRTSLATALEAVESRLARMPEDLAVLRREFSLGNWRDLDPGEKAVREQVALARTKLRDFDRLVEAGAEWTLPLRLLDEARAALDVAKAEVDGPGERLAALRAVKADPEDLLRKVRFRLRDAQLLVTNTPKVGRDAVARQLDDLARRLDGLRSGLRGAHPDYWALIQEADRITDAVKVQVERFRSL
ncbi:MAG: heat shock protein DnaJ protein [Nocardioides sp.]|nr:heat shock protein DnaJ protein [Nocardioides sp.]